MPTIIFLDASAEDGASPATARATAAAKAIRLSTDTLLFLGWVEVVVDPRRERGGFEAIHGR
jgi:hypothetical protein